MFKINQFLRNYTKTKSTDTLLNSENCLLNSLFADSKLNSCFNKKHFEDLNTPHLPPDHIELNQPEADFVLEIFNFLTLQTPETKSLDLRFNSIISNARIILMSLNECKSDENLYAQISDYFLEIGDI